MMPRELRYALCIERENYLNCLERVDPRHYDDECDADAPEADDDEVEGDSSAALMASIACDYMKEDLTIPAANVWYDFHDMPAPADPTSLFTDMQKLAVYVIMDSLVVVS